MSDDFVLKMVEEAYTNLLLVAAGDQTAPHTADCGFNAW